MIKKIIGITFLSSSIVTLSITPYYNARSQSINGAREIVGAGWNTQINLCNMNKWYGNFAITPEYTQSFKPENICRCLFGSLANYYNRDNSRNTSHMKSCDTNKCCFLNISGSQSENRGQRDLLADYFGLPTDYKGQVSFKPEISNFLVECSFYLGFDEWVPGLYLKFHAPIVHTYWNLNMCEYIVNNGTNNHPPGYFNSTLSGTEPDFYGIQHINLVPDFTSFITGCSIIDAPDIRFMPLRFAKMSRSDLTKTALADLRMELGWNFACDRHYNFGFAIQAAGPTGDRPEGFYLFEPIVGNGKHWEVGAGTQAFYDFYVNEDECRCASIYVDANITHPFRTKQVRSFDLCNRPLSRYMIAGKFESPVNGLKAGQNIESLKIPKKQFLGLYQPIANLTTFSVDVGINVQADIALMLQYMHSNFSCGIGYNFWGRTCENIEFRCDCPCPFDSEAWALKGDAFMYGFKENPDGSISSESVALSASQSHATICNGTNNPPNGFDNLGWPQNPGIDHRKPAWDSDNNQLIIFDSATSKTAQVYTSLDPILIDPCNINIDNSGTKGMSHKVFAHIDYKWTHQENWIPYVGLGGEVEFGHNDTCKNDCHSRSSSGSNNTLSLCEAYYDECRCCPYCSLSQWGVWLKGGIAFH